MNKEEIPKEILDCPFCDGESTIYLATKKYTYIPKDKNYCLHGDWWIYMCRKCGEGFTSTESDTISQNNLKQRKL